MAVAKGERCVGYLHQYDPARIMSKGGPPRSQPDDGGVDYGCRMTAIGLTPIGGIAAFPAGVGKCRWFV
eukprot:gene40594-26695_t